MFDLCPVLHRVRPRRSLLSLLLLRSLFVLVSVPSVHRPPHAHSEVWQTGPVLLHRLKMMQLISSSPKSELDKFITYVCSATSDQELLTWGYISLGEHPRLLAHMLLNSNTHATSRKLRSCLGGTGGKTGNTITNGSSGGMLICSKQATPPLPCCCCYLWTFHSLTHVRTLTPPVSHVEQSAGKRAIHC